MWVSLLTELCISSLFPFHRSQVSAASCVHCKTVYIVPYALFLFAVWIHHSEGAEAEHCSCYKETGEGLVFSVSKCTVFLQLHLSEMVTEHSEAYHLLLFCCCSLSTERMKLRHLLLFTAAQSSIRMVCHTLSTMEWHIFQPHLRSTPLATQLQQQVTLLACIRVSIVLTRVWMQDVFTHRHTHSVTIWFWFALARAHH
jgi:hypothetical protein